MIENQAITDAVRSEIIRYSRQLSTSDLIVGTAGNISVRNGFGITITPSGKQYETLETDDLCDVDSEGRTHESARWPASSETFLHLAAYEAQKDANAVVHFHGLHSVAVANAYDSLPYVHYYALRLGPKVPVAPYSLFGSLALAQDVSSALATSPAVLMRNHGAVVTGKTLEEAFNRAILLEWLCRLVTTSAPLGKSHTLTPEEVQEVSAKYAARENIEGETS